MPLCRRDTLFDPGWPNLTSYRSVYRYFTIPVNTVPSSTYQSLWVQQRRDASPMDALPNSEHLAERSTGNSIQLPESTLPKHPSLIVKQQQASWKDRVGPRQFEAHQIHHHCFNQNTFNETCNYLEYVKSSFPYQAELSCYVMSYLAKQITSLQSEYLKKDLLIKGN